MSFYVIGDIDTVTGFKLAGIDGRIASSAYEAQEALEVAVCRQGIKIIIMTEKIASLIRERIDTYVYEMEFPLIIEIPDASGPLDGRKGIEQIIKEAIGISI